MLPDSFLEGGTIFHPVVTVSDLCAVELGQREFGVQSAIFEQEERYRPGGLELAHLSGRMLPGGGSFKTAQKPPSSCTARTNSPKLTGLTT